MQNIDQLLTRYKTLDNAGLVAIINAPDDYLPIAIEAAQTELNNRKLSAAEIDEIKNAVLAAELEKNNRTKKVTTVGKPMANFLNRVHPDHDISASKHINLIAIILGCLFVALSLFDHTLKAILGMIIRPEYYNTAVLYFVITYLMLPAAAILFWLRKKAGWILVSLVSTNKALWCLYFFFRSLAFKMNASISDMIPIQRLVLYAIGVIISGAISGIVCRADIRSVFHINKKTMFITLGIAAMWTYLESLRY